MMSEKVVKIYDSTLREGSQCVGISFTVADKILLATMLDDMGVAFIEGGIPGSSPKENEFYKKMKDVTLKNSKLVAFGQTVRAGLKPEEDEMLKALAEAGTDYVAVFGKSSTFQVKEILCCELEENLRMIGDTISYLKKKNKFVFFDAEHFFDGLNADEGYAMKTLEAAMNAGADYLVLCDTNGGSFPDFVGNTVCEIFSDHPDWKDKIGIHVHNDSGFADYATITAVNNGANLVQVTLNGWGERCGNANLFTVVPNLQLKLGYNCLPNISELYSKAHEACETANVKMYEFSPFVGKNAFAHKAGVHIDAICKNTESYEHITPESVGNERRYKLSEVSGKAAVLAKINKLLPKLGCGKEDAAGIAEKLKNMEFEGYTFEGADASFEMMVMDLLGKRREWFKLNSYKVMTLSGEKRDEAMASAIVDVTVDGQQEVTAANGLGPVEALDGALRKALCRFYPCIAGMELVDYKVRVLESKQGAASVVRVVIESSDGNNSWCTVGVSADIICASFIALADAHEYMLSMHNA